MAQSQIICDASAIGKRHLTILQPSEELSGRLRLVAIFLGIATPVAVPIFEKKLYDCSQDCSPILGIPETISDYLRCPPINRRPPPNNLRLVERFCVGLQIQVEIQCLRVVSGDLRLNRWRPATTRTLSVIVSDESYSGIVVNRRVYRAPPTGLLKV